MVTLANYLTDWLQLHRAQVEPSTLRSYALLIERYVVPALGGVRLDELAVDAIDRFYADLLTAGGQGGRPLSLRTVRYCHAVLHKALGDAVRRGRTATNVSDLATLPRIDVGASGPTQQLRVWTVSELRDFLLSTAGHTLHHAWVVAAGTGIRRGELAGLQRGDVDIDERLLRVRRAVSVVGRTLRVKAPKSGRPRSLKIDDVTLAALCALGGGDGDDRYLLGGASSGGPINPMVLTSAFRRAVVRAGVPVIRLHDVRHTNATLMLEAGVPIKVVSERLGHASIQLTLDVYTHVLPAMDADAADRFAAHVWRKGCIDAGDVALG